MIVESPPMRRIKRCIASNFIYLLGGCIVTLEAIIKIWAIDKPVTDYMGYILIGELVLGTIMIILSCQTIWTCMSQLKLNETNEILKALFRK